MLEALRQGLGRHERRAFWEAIIAVCALVAAPEGKVSFATRVRIDNILDSLPDLKVFETSEFVELFDRLVEEFRVSPRKARARALEVVRKGADGDKEEAELLARIALAVADIKAGNDKVDLTSVDAVCAQLDVDPRGLLAAAPPKEGEVATAPPAAVSQPPANSKSTNVSPKEKPQMQEEQSASPSPSAPGVSSSSGGAGSVAKPDDNGARVAAGSPARETSNATDLSQQLLVDGSKAVIALCGRTKIGTMEALRIYENEKLAAADCALLERIANTKFWLSPVALFSSEGSRSGAAGSGEPTPIHVMCLSRPDGSVEALRAFENADHASADLEFFRNISNDKMWVSVVQYKSVT